jgi:membrane-bound lytic murein transglycosylase A
MMHKIFSSRLPLLALVALATAAVTSCGPVVTDKKDESYDLRLAPASYDDLPAWNDESFIQAAEAFKKSCARILKQPDQARALGPLPEAGTYGDWQSVCKEFITIAPQDAVALRRFFETRFHPYQVSNHGDTQGLFTGYYEASLRGSTVKQGPYQTPLYARPDDLVMVNLGDFREHLKGERIAGRVLDGNLKPYESRTQIVNGNWPHNDKVLLWVDDPVDAFFVQIQGSGVVDLPDGSTKRIGYAGQNGHPYYAIGRELIKRGEMSEDEVSLQTIRAWLEANPAQAAEIMNTNQSYVFFQELEGEGPIGGENVALTAGRSLAIDRSLLPYGIPVWLSVEHPVEGNPQINRLMIAQDTGGAIRGPVRGDFFWGYGPQAERHAGAMKSKGRYWVLLPVQTKNQN